MSSFIYPAAVPKLLSGEINFVTDQFGVILLDGSETPSEDDTYRSDLGSEISGQGYVSGGKDADVDVLVDRGGRTTVVLGGQAWRDSSLAARYAAYFHKPSDALIALIDFGKEVQSLNDVFSLTDSEIEVSLRSEDA